MSPRGFLECFSYSRLLIINNRAFHQLSLIETISYYGKYYEYSKH